MERLERLDEAIFLALNFDGGAAIDQLMLLISGRLTWVPFYLLIIFLIWRRYGWRTTIFAVLMIAAAVGLADQICNLFKDGLQMLRPNHDPDVIPQMHFPLRSNGEPYINPGIYGTVSAHAATTGAIAYLASSFIKQRWFTITASTWTLSICYSRIYLGAHYPSQVLAGIVLGLLIGALGVVVARRCGLYKAVEK